MIERIAELAERAGLALAAVSCAVLMAMTVADVMARPLDIVSSMSAELGIYFGAAVIFLALGDVTRANEHIKADFFENFIPTAVRPWLRVFFVDIVFLAYAVLLLWLCTQLTITSFKDGLRSQGLMTIPIGWPQIVMVVGLALLCLRLALQLVADLRNLLAPQAARRS